MQLQIFKGALSVLRAYDDSMTYLSGVSDVSETVDKIRLVVEKEWPYNLLHTLPALTKSVSDVISAKLSEKKVEVAEVVENDRKVVSDEFDTRLNILSNRKVKGYNAT